MPRFDNACFLSSVSVTAVRPAPIRRAIRRLAADLTRAALVAVGLLVLSTGTAAAQDLGGLPPGLGGLPSGVSEEEAIEQIRRSGLTRSEMQAQLMLAGYDPTLADRYFDRIEGRTQGSGVVSDEFTRALQEMGLLSITTRGNAPTASLYPDYIPPEMDPAVPDTVLRVFGRAVFSASTSQFTPTFNGPVDAGYRLGPGDDLRLIVTGSVQLGYGLQVARDGVITIPVVGQVFVSGLTLAELREALFDRLGAVYSGIRRDATATASFDVSLARVRFNQVFVIGDAVRPRAYQVSGVSTVFHALHQAGGPSDLGSFRRVIVRRANGDSVEVDLYDYLLRGDASRDVRLENGDIVFVPPAGAHVAVSGRVRRPAIYEVKAGETLRDVMAFAGGTEADAHLERIQIDRILAPEARVPGTDRVLLDVSVDALTDPDAEAVPLRDGDEIRVFAALVERRNRVVLTGSVRRPGLYEYRSGMTLGELINRADGVGDEAFLPVAHVLRPIPETGSARLLRAPLERNATGGVTSGLLLADRDSVVVYGVDSLSTPASVHIDGLVRTPGDYRFAEGMTVPDLILSAGGYRQGADAFEVEVVRLRQSPVRDEVIAESQVVVLEGDLPARWAVPGVGAATGPSADAFTLEDGDRVFVRQMPGYVLPRTVIVQGEASRPGPYGLESREERLSTIVQRAGGPTEEAYVRGAGLVRDSILVGIDLTAAMADPGGEEDVVLRDGDVVVIPRYDPTVLVQGAVAFESRVFYEDGLGVDDYLGRSGGALRGADLDQVSVLYPSGERATVRKFLWIRRYPAVQPGSRIHVPAKEGAPGTNWDLFLTRTLAITSTIATLIIATK